MTNQNLNVLVSGMLANTKTKKALNVVAIKNLINKVNEAEKQRFLNSLELSQVIAQTENNFNDFVKLVSNRMKDAGILPSEVKDRNGKKCTIKQYCIEIAYGFQSAQFYKLLRVGNLPKNVVNKFNDKCDELRTNGEKPQQSIEALETWAKNFDSHKGEAGTTKDEITELREESNGKSNKPTIVWSINDGNKKLKVYSDGSHDGNFTAIEINAFLDSTLITFIRSTFPIKKTTTATETRRLEKMQKTRINKVSNTLNGKKEAIK